jgi:zinc/manganese transport system permease protein
VGGFYALATLMAVGIILLPAVTARFWAEDTSKLIMVAVLSALGTRILGRWFSYYGNLPSDPAIIPTCGILSILSSRCSARQRNQATASSQAPGCPINLDKED